MVKTGVRGKPWQRIFNRPDDGGGANGTQGDGTQGAAQGAEGSGTGGQGDTGDGQGAGNANTGGITPNGVPVEFQAFTVPESFGGIDSDTHAQISALARESGMSQQQAQRWVDIGARKFDDGMTAVRLQIAQKFEEWENASRNDDEIKPFLNDSGKLPKVSEMINRAMGNDTKAFHDMAEETGIGANPLFIKFCIRMSKLMGEAPFVGGSVGGSGKQMSMLEQAKTMYPNM